MAAELERYKSKRDFALTREPPPGEPAPSTGVLRFVVQKHAATRLHYDFRLEYEGVLKSWAVTRGPSIDPHERRLAVETEDHPLDYATFEGTIPKGEYGGGTVMVWDEGTWAMADGKDAAEGFAHGSLSFDLFGQRLKGRWHLQRMRAEKNRPPQWLLVKAWDSEAHDLAKDPGPDVIETFTTSAVTDRSLEAIADGDAVWHSNRGEAAKKSADDGGSQLGTAKGSGADEVAASGPKTKRARRGPAKRTASPDEAAARSAILAEVGGDKSDADGADLPKLKPAGALRSRAAREPDQAVLAAHGNGRTRQAAIPVTAEPTAIPQFVEPSLCKARTTPPKGEGWLAEVKYDGYRAILRAVRGEVKILTRSALDWTARFPAIAEAARAFADRDVMLDGEIVVFDDAGRTRFDTLQKAFKSAGAISAVYIAFDCLFDDGEDVRAEPIEDRKARVKRLVGSDGAIRYGDHIAGRQADLYARAVELGLEGIVAKRASSLYRSGRTEQWVKVRAVRRARFVVGAYTDSTDGKGLGALVMGAYRAGKLVPCGRVGTGFTRAEAARLLADLETLAATSSPFAQKLVGRGYHYVRPERVAEIAYLTITDDGQLRHGVYHGIVEAEPSGVSLPSDHPAENDRDSGGDDPATSDGVNGALELGGGEAAARTPTSQRAITAGAADGGKARSTSDETDDAAISKVTDHAPRRTRKATDGASPEAVAGPGSKATGRGTPSRAKTPVILAGSASRKPGSASLSKLSRENATFLGVTLSHPEKVLFPEQQITKAALAQHYVTHMERMLPHVIDRPLTLVRCPQGRTQKCFYQRHPEGLPAQMARDIGDEDGEAIVITQPSDVIELVQKGVLEIHLRSVRTDMPDRPDRLVFDLDPGDGVPFEEVKDAAFTVRAALDAVDLEAFVKTTGGKGLHVVVPIARRQDWGEAKTWTRDFSSMLAEREPNRFLITMQKVRRKGRIFLDYLRNDWKASAVAPYSVRSREGAPFSFPIDWDDLPALPRPAPYHVGESAPGDPWVRMNAVRQRLTARHLRLSS